MIVQVKGPTLTAALLFWHALFGVGYILGGPRVTSAGGFRYAVELANGHTWGLLLLAGVVPTAIAPWLEWWGSALLHLIATTPFAVMATCIGWAEWSGISQGVGGTFLSLGPCIVHVLLIRGRYRQRDRRTPRALPRGGAPCST